MYKLFFFIFCILFLNACIYNNKSFQLIKGKLSGIQFSNTISENDSINIIDYEYVYNGSGVGIADFNNDGLQDIYFAGNMVSNKLYLNKGSMKFTDITAESNTAGEHKWCNGVSVIDINNDGWMDIFISASRNSDAQQRKKILYINQGINKNGIPVFKDEAEEYGLNDTSYSTTAAFFDYDNDGDLDLFLLVAGKIQKNKNPNTFLYSSADTSAATTSQLYQNNFDSKKHHAIFKNVTRTAGITKAGYGLGVNITDINKDGWKDIFISNDYLSNDQLWINNKNGTFTDLSASFFKHTSFSAMGNDVQDLNNDGLCDIIELDMAPRDNYRKKMMLNPNNYDVNKNFETFKYQFEYGRNTLQLNCGPALLHNDSVTHPVFSEISFLSNIAETDWSWAPLVADFDNDGFRDIIITNGLPKDLTDHDFISFRSQSNFIASKEILISKMPAVKLTNYAFHNNGNLTFSNVSTDWGITQPTFSNGAAYADFDNDGDLDYVVNNINDEASLYENHSCDKKSHNHFLHVNFKGDSLNINGIGAWIELHYNHGCIQVFENTPYRGYLSSMQPGAHFGIGNTPIIDSIIVKWPNGKMQLLQHVQTDKSITIKQSDATTPYTWLPPHIAKQTFFREITDSIKANIVNKEDDFIDFNIQKLLPHKLSDYGPAIAVADVDGNGTDDIAIGGSYGYSTQILYQQKNGSFIQKDIIPQANRENKPWEDMGILLFDADGDKDNDLYIAAGSNEFEEGSSQYQDKLYINDGKGNFGIDTNALPQNHTSKSCVRAIDIDTDGDLDLFIAGRCLPSKYPQPVSCFIYRNDSKNGIAKFTDISATIAPALQNIGMVCDALFTDFNNDGWTDLILAGEFMPLKFFKNEHGSLKLISTNIDNESGAWNSIISGDFDNDGDIDYIAGNMGQNSFYRPSHKYPVRIYGKDFDSNGIYDALPSIYLPASATDTIPKEFPAQLRDDEIRQLIEIRRKFPTYKSYATATFNELLSKEQLKNALIVSANNFQTSYIRNDGNAHFTLFAMPVQAQLSSIFGMVAEDIDGDGNLDVIMNGNDYGTEVSVGRYDALNGLVLKGNGKGNFSPLSILQSGIYIPGNGKALAKFCNSRNQCLIAASQNRGVLKVFLMKQPQKIIPVQANENYAILHLKNGKKRKLELHFGEGFLSQQGRFINMTPAISSIDIYNDKGTKRSIQ